jgi:hypothetical protein
MLTEKSKLDFASLPLHPRKLISLWQMIRFNAMEAANKVAHLNILEMEVDDERIKQGTDSVFGKEGQKRLLAFLAAVKDFCKTFELKSTLARVEQFSIELAEKPHLNMVVCSEIGGIHTSIIDELDKRYCAFIPSDKVEFFEQNKLFGDDVWGAFPEARDEIKSVGNCLAADLNTACVFHLMRVAEIGLQKLARSLKVKLPCQIEFATWGNITSAISDELQKIKSSRKTSARDKKLQHCSQLLLDIKAFQYLWRDPVSHLRGTFDALQARSAFNHVNGFMQKVSIKRLPR